MTGVIQITTFGPDTGPLFNLYSDVDGYISAFATDVTKAELLAGYATDQIPDGTLFIKVVSLGICTNNVIIPMNAPLCYQFGIDSGFHYHLDYIIEPTQTYVYGNFSKYLNGIDWEPTQNLVLLNTDRSINFSFDTSTAVNFAFYDGESILKQSDGKILITGNFTSYKGVGANRIVRVNTDASIDGTFVYGTGFNNFTQGIAIDSLGRIIVLGKFTSYNGNSAPRIARLSSTGTFDGTFTVGTGFNNTGIDILMNPDDSMYITGYFDIYNGTGGLGGICKLDSTGAIDLAFKANSGTGFNIYLPEQPANFSRIDGETSFYVTGYFTSYNGTSANRIIKLNSDGTIDGSANFGTGFNNLIWTCYIIWGDKLLIEGVYSEYNGTPCYNFIVLNADGSIFYNPSEFEYVYWYYMFPIGNTLYASYYDDCLVPIYYYDYYSTTTTTSTSSTTTSTTTIVPITTTTTSTTAIPITTTTTTTIDCTCNEYQLDNYSLIPGNLLYIRYVDCSTKLTEEITVLPDSSGNICSCSSPVRIGGSSSYAIVDLGACELL